MLLAARCCGYDGSDHIRLAAIIEFLHTATLLHDDVVDSSRLRRGRATANVTWGNAPSVLVGDFLYSRAFQLMVDLDDMDIMAIVADATNIIAEGEVLQLDNIGNAAFDEAGYMEVILRKTALLFQAAAHTAAVLATGDPDIIQSMLRCGRDFGLAYQLVDDWLDYEGDSAVMGKNIGDDLAEGKATLPLIRTMKYGRAEDAALVRDALETRCSDALTAVRIRRPPLRRARLHARPRRGIRRPRRRLPRAPARQHLPRSTRGPRQLRRRPHAVGGWAHEAKAVQPALLSKLSASDERAVMRLHVVGACLNIRAPRHEFIERLARVEQHSGRKHSGRKHPSVVFGQRTARNPRRNQAEFAQYGCRVVDPISLDIFLAKETLFVTRDSENSVRQRFCREARVVQPDNVMPMPRKTISPLSLLQTEDMRRRGLLPERPFGKHDGGTRNRKRDIGQEVGGITCDRTRFTRFTRGASAELHHDFRPHKILAIEQGLIVDMKLVVIGPNPGGQAGSIQAVFDSGQSVFANPIIEFLADLSSPTPRLAARGGKDLRASPCYQVWRERANVVGDVDVFRETGDRAPSLGKRCATLEHQVFAEWRIEQNTQDFDDPNVLFQKIGATTAQAFGDGQSVAAVVYGERMERRLSHWRPAH